MSSLQVLIAVDKYVSVHMLVVQYQTPNFRQKKMARRPEAMSGIILPTTIKENSSRCLVQKCQKQCGEILKGMFATNTKLAQERF